MNNTIETIEFDTSVIALANYLEIDPSEINITSYGEFETPSGDFMVLSDDEADEKCREYILDSLWAFNAEFIASHTKEGLDVYAISAIKKMQGELCESANPIIKALIADVDHFIEDAISADGRGHFINGYDGEEIELANNLYAYRTN